MLRFVVLTLASCLLAKPAISQSRQTSSYVDPKAEEIQKSKMLAHQAIDDANQMDVQSEILDMIEKMSSMDPEVIHQIQPSIKLPEFYQTSRQAEYLKKAQAAAKQIETQSETNKKLNRLLVFVSFSMPQPMIKRLLLEAKALGAGVVIRGLVDNDIKKTYQTIKEMSDDPKQMSQRIGLMIDPTLFERFSVQQVPTFVLVLEDFYPCTASCTVPKHIKAQGEATLKYFIELVERSGQGPAIEKVAKSYLVKFGSR